MRSRCLTLAAMLFLMMGLSGCDYFLSRQGPPAQDRVELHMNGMACLRQVPSDLTRWLKDELPAEQITQSFNCLDSTLQQFQMFSRGTEDRNQYTGEELRSFVNEVLPEKHKVSKDLMAQLMKLKTVLVGGHEETMTRPELERARGLIDVFEHEATALRGMMRMLLFQADKSKVELGDLKMAQRQLEVSMSNIMQIAKPEAIDYRFEELTSLIAGLDVYLGSNRLLSKLLNWLPLTHKFKVLFLGDRSLVYTQKDWAEMLGWSVRAYGIVLEFVYKVRGYDINSPGDMEKIISFGDSVFDLVDSSPTLKEKGYLSLEAFDDVFSEVMNAGLIKTTVSEDLLKETIRKALMIMIDGPGAPRREIFQMDGITKRQLNTMRFEWNVFVLAQRQINQVFLAKERPFFSELLALLKADGTAEEVRKRGTKPGEAAALMKSWQEWTDLMTSDFPVVWDQYNRMAIRAEIQNTQLGFRGMTTANLLRSFTRAIMRGYGTGSANHFWNLTIDEDQFSLFETDFRQFGEAIQFLDKRAYRPAARTLQEANFFTFHGNGDKVLDSRELFEELNILTSAGGLIANELMNRAIAEGCAVEHEVDVFGKPYLNRDCFTKVFRRDFLRSFQSAPGLVQLQASLFNDPKESDFYESIYRIGRAPFSIDGLVEYGDIRTYATILYYVEVLRVVYDADGDMRLSQSEIDAAAPRFRRFIAEKSPLGSTMVDSFFSCLVFEQVKPGANWSTANCFGLGWIGYDPVSPAELLKVLAVLKADLMKEAEQAFTPAQ